MTTASLTKRPSLGRPVRGTLTGSLVAAIASAASTQVILVVSGIELARLLGPGGRGVLAFAVLWPTILFQLCALGLPLAVTYETARMGDRGTPGLRSLGRPLALQLVMVVGGNMLAIAVFADRTADGVFTALAALPIGPLMLVQEYGLGILQGQRRMALMLTLRLMSPTLVAVAAGALLLLHHHNLILIATLASVASFLACFCTVLTVWASVVAALPHASLPFARLLGYGARAYFGSLYPIDAFRLDQLLVSVAFVPSSLGIYVVATAFTNLPRFLAQGVGWFALTAVAGSRNYSARRDTMFKFATATVVMNLAILLVLWAAIPLVLPLAFGSAFATAIPIARISVIGGAFYSSRRVLGELAKGAGVPILSSIGEAVALVATGAALLVFLRYGMPGVAMAVAAGAVVSLAALSLPFLAIARRPFELAEMPAS